MAVVCFVSDLHLFARRSSAASHYDDLLAAASQADRLVLGGDIFDFRWSTLANRELTASAALDWLRDLHEALPSTEIHYLLGNHDHVEPLVESLPSLCRLHPRLSWQTYYLRIGSAVFLHGDVADRPMTTERFERRRSRSLHHGRRRRGRLSNTAYAALLQTRTHQIVPRVVYPNRVAARRILTYLDRIGQRDGVREVFFGHTHRPIDAFGYRGVTFHNPGATIGQAPLVVLRTEIDDTSIAAG